MSAPPAESLLPPFATRETRAFWEGCRRGELLLQRCGACGGWQFYPRPFCVACSAPEPSWAVASGRGTVRSWSVVRRPVDPAWTAEAPYVLALVALDEGPTMMTALAECPPDRASIGLRVEVVFEERGGFVLPRFRPAAG